MCATREDPKTHVHAMRVSNPEEFLSLPREYLGEEIRYESMMTDDDHPLRTFFELRPCPGMGFGVFVRPDFINIETEYDPATQKKRKRRSRARQAPCQGVPAGTVIPYGLGKDVTDTGPDDNDEYAIRIGDRILSFAHDRTLASFVNDPRGTGLEANSIIVGDGDTARISIQLTRTVAQGEQILVCYGDEFWNHDHSRVGPKPARRPPKPVVVDGKADPRSQEVYAHYFSPDNHYPNFLQYNTMHGAYGTRGSDFIVIDRSYRESIKLHECLDQVYGRDYLELHIDYSAEMWSFLRWQGVPYGPLTLRMHKMCLRGWPFNEGVSEPDDASDSHSESSLDLNHSHWQLPPTLDFEPVPAVPDTEKRKPKGLSARKKYRKKKRDKERSKSQM